MEERKVNDLVPFEKNPKKISKKRMNDLLKNLKKYNLVKTPAPKHTIEILKTEA